MKLIETAIKDLLENKPFYSHFFLNSKVCYDKYNIPTAAATITSTGPVIIFNTEFMMKHSPKEVSGIIEHEVLHLLFEHVFALIENKLLDKNISNIAMDYAINQFISVLPKECINQASIEKMTGLKLPPNETWEFYYEKLMRVKDKLIKEYSFDIHDLELTDENGKPLSKGEAQAVLKEALGKAIKASNGNVPGAVSKVYDSLTADAKVPWQQVLANFVARASSSFTRHTRKKVNRRFGLDLPGKVKKRELTLAVCTDSSGSISDESYEQFMNEITRISSLCSKAILIDADCEVQAVTTIKKKRGFNRERKGFGGTAYQPAITEAMKHKADAIIYFGDMDSADKPENPGVPFLWVVVGQQEPPGKFGHTIRL